MYLKVLLFLFCALALMIIWQPAGSRANQNQNDHSEPKGLEFRLSEAAVDSEPVTPIARPSAAMLGDSEVASLLDRLPPLKVDPGDQQQSSLRGQSLPPPRTGTVLTASFPPSESVQPPENIPSGPLEVVRFSPQGQVPIAPELSVTFSQPMVAVTSQELAAATVPVKLTPQPAGHWRWLGTKTVVFEPDGRFPMATSYSVEVPAGTKSVTGGTLPAARKWSFVTPPPHITRHYPEGENQTYSRNPLLFIEFDQRVDEAAALRSIRITAASQQWQIRPASADEIAADENITRLIRSAVKDRYLAFRVLPRAGADAQQPLPGGTTISVAISAGFKSAEGPRPTTEPQSFGFQTYGPLHFARRKCGYESGDCRPGMPWQLFFSNTLDLSAFDKAQIKVEPELPGFDAHVYGDQIAITGVAKGRTLYRVKFDAGIRDQFGQTLGQAAPVEVNVGPMEPAIAGPAMGFVVLDPAAPRHFSIYSVNQKSVNLSIYAVGPQDWSAYLSYLKTTNEGHSATPPGRLMTTRTVPINAAADQLTETTLDISSALKNGFGQLFVLVTPGTRTASSRRQNVTAWVQSTQIGLDAFVDDRNLTGWATSLKDGKPIDGVELSIASATNDSRAVTRADGIATLRLPASNAPRANLLIARKGEDLAILPDSVSWWGRETGWRSVKRVDWLNWYVADDRGLYRPGEEVHVKGWIRRIGYGPEGDVSPSTGVAREVSYVLKDSVGNEVLKGRLPVNGFGGFDAALKLPANMNLGPGNLEMNAEGDDPAGVDRRKSHHTIRVEEFRRPEYEVNVTATEGLHFVGEHANVIASASYYAGGGLPNAEVEWNVVATTTNYTPPNRSDFIFGKWIPWWGSQYSNEAPRQEHFSGHTDASGKHRLRIDFDSARPALPTSVTANAAVTDVNRQAWSGSQTLLVHPANLYVGLRSKRTFVEMGQPLTVESIVTDLDGKAVAQREVRMRAVLLDWKYEKDRWREIEVNPQDCVIKSGVDPVSCQFQTKQGGRYRIVAIVKDDKGRDNQSEMILWVSGGKMLPQRDVAEEKVELIPDRREYHDGDTAEVLVQAPFYPAEGVLTLRRSGLLKTEHFTMDGPSHTLHIPISEAYVPNVHVEVLLNGASTRTDDAGEPNRAAPKRPAFAAGSLNLEVPPVKRELTVRATPKETSLEPGAETTVDVEVKDRSGRAVPDSEVALIVVDEAILALTGFRIHDPSDTFYQDRSPDVRDYHLRSSVTLARPQDLNGQLRSVNGKEMAQTVMISAAPTARAMDALSMADSGVAGGGGRGGIEQTTIRARTNFNPLAKFSPSVVTDSAGRASVKIKLPDNLTRYRVTAIAVAGSKQFGMGESAITARLPLMVRLSAPRFLNFGDRFELPVVVQNQTDNPLDVSVAVRAGNAILTNGGGRKITVPANDRVEVRFPVKSSMPGTARFQVAGAAGRWADASEVSLPVWTPATTEAFATYGEVDKGSIIQPVTSPSDVIPQFGGLEVSTSSTQLQALTDAFIYLVDYPFECSEQLASRVLAVAALRDVLGAFDAKGLPKPDELTAAVTRDIRRLQGIQNEDGSFGFWRRGDRAWPYLGIHAANALIHAKQKGFEVPASMLERSKRYLAAIETRIPADYSEAARQSLIAYALNVQYQMGDRPLARARRLITETGLEKMPLEALGWLLPVLSSDPAETSAVLKLLNNRVQETASAANFTTSYSDGAQLLLHSDRRADGVILEGLIAADKSSDLIPKVVRGLLAHRVNGRWANTQENAFVLLALDRYFATYEKQTPDFVARAWLGEAYAGEHTFKGRSTDRYQIEVPMKEVVGRDKLVLSKEGEGRLYYRIGMRYAPSNLQLQQADYGFTVARVYEAVDKPSDVRREEDGTWHIKAGATVRVRVTMVAPARRYHVALVDPLPAGLEALNPSLAVTPEIPRDPQNPGGPRPLWSWRVAMV